MEILIEPKCQLFLHFEPCKISMDTFTHTSTWQKYPWIFWQSRNATQITKHHESTFGSWTLYATDDSFIHLLWFSSDLNAMEIHKWKWQRITSAWYILMGGSRRHNRRTATMPFSSRLPRHEFSPARRFQALSYKEIVEDDKLPHSIQFI